MYCFKAHLAHESEGCGIELVTKLESIVKNTGSCELTSMGVRISIIPHYCRFQPAEDQYTSADPKRLYINI